MRIKNQLCNCPDADDDIHMPQCPLIKILNQRKRQKKYRQSEKGKSKRRAQSKRWREKNPKKVKEYNEITTEQRRIMRRKLNKEKN